MEAPEKTKKGNKKKLLAVSLIALLAVASIAAVSMVEAATPGAQSSVTQGTNTTNGEYLEVVVWAQLNGNRVPVPNADVTVYSISATNGTNGNITITLSPIAKGVTNSHGAVYFNIDNGKYAIIANYNGHRGGALLNLRFYTTKFVQLGAPVPTPA